ncbi:MAG: hypothetical protein II954_10900 [Synergistaceae bacterium]|nr:hypothetical protein [Synergistaceae bacterium]
MSRKCYDNPTAGTSRKCYDNPNGRALAGSVTATLNVWARTQTVYHRLNTHKETKINA